MSIEGLKQTVLATQLIEAFRKDTAAGNSPINLEADGGNGRVNSGATADWLRMLATQIAPAKINTHTRLFDLVRFMRSELHEAGLITDEEYGWLLAEAPMAKGSGSPSPRRLEDYDELRKRLTQLEAALVNVTAHDGPGFPLGTCANIAAEALGKEPVPTQGVTLKVLPEDDRYRYALSQIGFYFAGTDEQHIADICIRVLNGESLQQIRGEISNNPEPETTCSTSNS